MSISAKDRLANIDFALKLLLERLGKRTLGGFHIVTREPDYKEILPPTWHELANKSYIRSVSGGRYVLTGEGYRRAMELYDMQDTPEVRDMLAKLCRHLKDSISRAPGAGVSVQSVMESTGLPKFVIINTIDAKLIEHWLKRYGADWVPSFVGSMIQVPANFGLSRT